MYTAGFILWKNCHLKECKVVSGESIARQYQMVVCRMTLEIKKEEGEGRGKDSVVKVEEERCAEFREELRKTVW